MFYEIEITETLTRICTVKADSRGEAEAIIKSLYDNGKIVLDADDFVDANIAIVDSSKHTDLTEEEYYDAEKLRKGE